MRFLFSARFFFFKKKTYCHPDSGTVLDPEKKKGNTTKQWGWKTFTKTIFWGRNLIRFARFRNTQDDSKPATRRREFGNGARASRLHVHEQSANAAELCLGNLGEIKSTPKNGSNDGEFGLRSGSMWNWCGNVAVLSRRESPDLLSWSGLLKMLSCTTGDTILQDH